MKRRRRRRRRMRGSAFKFFYSPSYNSGQPYGQHIAYKSHATKLPITI
jgi:hypothetical protein